MDITVRTDLPLPQTVQPPVISAVNTQMGPEKAENYRKNALAGDAQAEPVESRAQEKPSDGQQTYDRVMAQKAVDNANRRVHTMGTSARFEYNKDINRITITLLDRKSGDVIREIPPEQTQKMLERIHTMTGVLMDTEA